jgi:hypothetical protein
MDRFVNRRNIERYRRLADETTDATERLRVIKLLSEERAKFKLEFKVRDAMASRDMASVRPFESDREEQRGAD